MSQAPTKPSKVKHTGYAAVDMTFCSKRTEVSKDSCRFRFRGKTDHQNTGVRGKQPTRGVYKIPEVSSKDT